MKLQSEYDIIYVNKQLMFGNNDISDDVDATILMGEFTLEDVQLPPKMLVCRLNSMLSSNKYTASKKEDMAKNIYKSLRSIAGNVVMNCIDSVALWDQYLLYLTLIYYIS